MKILPTGPSGHVISRRIDAERKAYIQGFEAGTAATLREVARLNFSHVAEMAEERMSISLRAIKIVDEQCD